MKLYLVRHTTVSVAPGICYGVSDIEPSVSFAAEAQAIKEIVPKAKMTISSPLIRCAMLAKEIAGEDFRIDDRLKELNFGSWELMEWSKIPQEELAKWSADLLNQRPGGGESYSELWQRTAGVLLELGGYRDEEAVVLVSHSGPLRALAMQLLKIPKETYPSLAWDYGAVSAVDVSANGNRLLFHNVRPTLPGGLRS